MAQNVLALFRELELCFFSYCSAGGLEARGLATACLRHSPESVANVLIAELLHLAAIARQRAKKSTGLSLPVLAIANRVLPMSVR